MNLRNYVLVTASYWAFTVTDGALRMLVLLYFHELGYSAVSLAFLFLLYEFFGVVTNLVGGWVGARRGLKATLTSGLGLQVLALLALSVHSESSAELQSVIWVMAAQALSGIAKDLTKMSSKTAVKFVASESALFRWVAILTGSKNALKGVGFFVGAALLGAIGFDQTLWILGALVAAACVMSIVFVDGEIGGRSQAATLSSVWAKTPSINLLSLARLFLFGARDIWFVVALPVFLDDVLGWSFRRIGAFMAVWVIGYGIVQSLAPRLLRGLGQQIAPERMIAVLLVPLGAVTAAIASAVAWDIAVTATVIVGLLLFGVIFALNSSLHSYLILALSEADSDTAMDVGFYYSANAAGRLIGTLLSGVLAMLGGLSAALLGTLAFIAASAIAARRLSTV